MNRLHSLNNPASTSYGFNAIWYPVLRQNKGKSFAQSEGKQLPFFQEQREGSNSWENTTTTKVKHFGHRRHLSEGFIQAVYIFASVRSFQMPKTSQDVRDTMNVFTTYTVNHARLSHSPLPTRTSDVGKTKRNRKRNFRSNENMMDYFKNRSFSQDGNGFSDCVFTQSVENGCQNKESY